MQFLWTVFLHILPFLQVLTDWPISMMSVSTENHMRTFIYARTYPNLCGKSFAKANRKASLFSFLSRSLCLIVRPGDLKSRSINCICWTVEMLTLLVKRVINFIIIGATMNWPWRHDDALSHSLSLSLKSQSCHTHNQIDVWFSVLILSAHIEIYSSEASNGLTRLIAYAIHNPQHLHILFNYIRIQ